VRIGVLVQRIAEEGDVASWTDRGSPGECLGRAKAQLIDVADTIKSMRDCSRVSIELIEATRAIHTALIALGALEESLDDAPSGPYRARTTSRNGEVSQRTVTRLLTASPGPAAATSLLDDDLLEPIETCPMVDRGDRRPFPDRMLREKEGSNPCE
jgi:hypothetical protein